MELIPDLHIGANAVIQKKIEEADTVRGMGKDSLESLMATTAYIDMMIRASVQVLKPNFPYQTGFITVGTAMSFVHRAPSSIGMTVSVKSTLVKIDVNHFYFEIEAYDEAGIVGTGTHERVMVKREGLMEKVRERMGNLSRVK
jgi:fluoroacetyl-CoA thioesterase